MKYNILIFESIYKVLKAEKILLKDKIKHDIIPTPKDITSDCGMAIRINPEIADMQKAKKILEDNELEFKVREKEII